MAERIGANQDAAAQYGNIGAGNNAGSTPGVSGDFSGPGGGGGGSFADRIAGAAQSFLNGVGAGVRGAFGGNGGSTAQDDYAAQQAAYAAQQAAAREAAMNLAKQQAKDRKIAADTQKAQRARAKAPSAPSAQMETGKKGKAEDAKKGHDTIVITADSLQELNNDTKALYTRAQLCQLAPLTFEQISGLNTVLPFGVMKTIDKLRTLTTESVLAFIPFTVQEIMDKVVENLKKIGVSLR